MSEPRAEQHEEAGLRRLTDERAEIERQTDALVLRTLAALVTAAEDLKAKLRRETDSLLEEYQRAKELLDDQHSLVESARQEVRREAEQEREAILAEAREQARAIVDEAQRERESLLAEVRAVEQRLRLLDGQIRTVLGLDVPTRPDRREEDEVTAPGTALPTRPTTRSVPTDEPSRHFTPVDPAGLTRAGAVTADEPGEPEDDAADPPAVGSPRASGASSWRAASADPDRPFREPPDEPEPADEPTVPRRAPFEPLRTAGSVSPPTTARPARPPVDREIPASRPASSPRPSERPGGRPRPVELVFAGVPGYQHATAIERAVNDLLLDGEVDVVEFEAGQLVLRAQAADLRTLAERLVATAPASLELADCAGDRAAFRVF